MNRNSSSRGTNKDSNTGSQQQPGKLFVGGLAFTTTDEALYKYFSKFGRVTSAVVMRNPSSKRSRGFGFVMYDAPTSAVACVDFAGTHVVDDQEVDVKHATPRVDATPTETVSKHKNVTKGKGFCP